MKFYPKFSGTWYGVSCEKGVAVELPESLASKAAKQPENFSKPGRKVKSRGEDAS